MGFGGIPYFIKMDSLHVKQLMLHPLDWEWVLYNPSLKGCSYVIRGARQWRWWSSMLERHQGGGKLLHIKTGLVLRPFESFYNYFIRFAVILIRYRITDS
jgi:hypothetical protein